MFLVRHRHRSSMSEGRAVQPEHIANGHGRMRAQSRARENQMHGSMIGRRCAQGLLFFWSGDRALQATRPRVIVSKSPESFLPSKSRESYDEEGQWSA